MPIAARPSRFECSGGDGTESDCRQRGIELDSLEKILNEELDLGETGETRERSENSETRQTREAEVLTSLAFLARPARLVPTHRIVSCVEVSGSVK